MSVKAKTSGSLISSLFFQHVNSPGDQEGFIIGEILNHVVDTISDSQIQNFKEESITYVHSFLPCNGLRSFYDVGGRVDIDKLHKILGSQNKHVIGWYKFRRNSPLHPSLRERCLHSKLSSLFPGVQSKQFLFALFTASLSSTSSTHSFDQLFLQCDKKTFQPLHVEVSNLGEAAHSPYRLVSSLNSGMYADTVTQFESQFCDSEGQIREVETTHLMNNTLNSRLQELSMNVTSSEEHLAELLHEVESLRALVRPERKPLPEEPIDAPPEEEVSLIDMDLDLPPPTPPKAPRPACDSPPPPYAEATRINKPLPPEPFEIPQTSTKSRKESTETCNNASNHNNKSLLDDHLDAEECVDNERGKKLEHSNTARSDATQNVTKTEPAKPADPFSFVSDLLKGPQAAHNLKGSSATKQSSGTGKSENAVLTGSGQRAKESVTGAQKTETSKLDSSASDSKNKAAHHPKTSHRNDRSGIGGRTHLKRQQVSSGAKSHPPPKDSQTNEHVDGKRQKELKITHKPAIVTPKTAAPLAEIESSDGEEIVVCRSNSPTF